MASSQMVTKENPNTSSADMIRMEVRCVGGGASPDWSQLLAEVKKLAMIPRIEIEAGSPGAIANYVKFGIWATF
jgi:hypothetical protein